MSRDELAQAILESLDRAHKRLDDIGTSQNQFGMQLSGLVVSVKNLEDHQCPAPGLCIEIREKVAELEKVRDESKGALKTVHYLGATLVALGSSVLGAALAKLWKD